MTGWKLIKRDWFIILLFITSRFVCLSWQKMFLLTSFGVLIWWQWLLNNFKTWQYFPRLSEMNNFSCFSSSFFIRTVNKKLLTFYAHSCCAFFCRKRALNIDPIEIHDMVVNRQQISKFLLWKSDTFFLAIPYLNLKQMKKIIQYFLCLQKVWKYKLHFHLDLFHPLDPRLLISVYLVHVLLQLHNKKRTKVMSAM